VPDQTYVLVHIDSHTDPATGRFVATAPVLGGCRCEGRSAVEVLPKLRLQIEAAITERLLAGEPLPTSAADGGATVHINVTHLRALAAHQGGR
jgi:hypothetical protein